MGVVGLLLASRHATVSVIGVELDANLVSHAAANARGNRLEGRFRQIRGDLRAAPRFLPPEHFHRVVANPPFRKAGAGAAPPDPVRAGARTERTATLSDFITTAAALLKFGGAFDVVHLVERLPELFATLASVNLEPKRMRLVSSRWSEEPRLCLLEALKGGRPGLRVLPQLVLDGQFDTVTARDKKHLPDK